MKHWQANGVEANGLTNGDVRDAAPPSIPLGARRRLRVACMGAGFSGVYMSILAEKVLHEIDLVIYEKNSDLGGTWFENRYPGCACDIPAHNYTYSFEPYPKFVG
jgi:cation diffusion facilitator CzcD-associated flavoprotein CzcO